MDMVTFLSIVAITIVVFTGVITCVNCLKKMIEEIIITIKHKKDKFAANQIVVKDYLQKKIDKAEKISLSELEEISAKTPYFANEIDNKNQDNIKKRKRLLVVD